MSFALCWCLGYTAVGLVWAIGEIRRSRFYREYLSRKTGRGA